MYHKDNGCFEITSIPGVTLYLHWTFPIGGALVCGFFGGSLKQLAFYVLSYSLLIFTHELGHLIAAKSFNLKVAGIKITGAGGMCYCENPSTYIRAFTLYSGGLIAQALALALTITFIELFGYPAGQLGTSFVQTFTAVNIFMFVVNLVPSKNSNGEITDGYLLWQTIRQWLKHA